MSPVDVEEIIEQNPGRDFRLTLSSGDTVTLRRSEIITISGGVLHTFVPVAPGRLTGRVRYFSTVNIAVMQPVDASDPQTQAGSNSLAPLMPSSSRVGSQPTPTCVEASEGRELKLAFFGIRLSR